MVLMISLLMACGDSDPAPKAVAPLSESTVAVSAVAPVEVGPELLEALKTADAADGTEDKVANMCSGCALSMSGKAAHSVSVDGYSLHLCSAMCKENFSQNLEANLKQLIN